MGVISRAARRASVLPGSQAWAVHWEAMKRLGEGRPVTVLSIGEPDAETVQGVNEAGVEAIWAGKGRTYSHGGGLPQLKTKVAERYGRMYNIDVDPRRVFVTAGAQNALFQVLRTVMDEDSEIITPDPCYVTYHGTIVANGGVVTPLALKPADGFQVKADKIAQKITKRTRGVLVNTPNNPTGAIVARPDMEEIAALCKEKGLWLMSDEVYSDYIFGKREHVPSISVPGGNENCITINAVSKSFSMVGWRVGWAIVPEPLIDPMQAVTEGMLFGISPISEAAALKALEVDCDSEAYGKEYEARFKAVIENLQNVPGVIPRETEGGLFVLADVSGTGFTANEFAWKLLNDFDVSVLPADAFGEAGTGHIRISLTKNAAILKTATERIAQCAKEVLKETGADNSASVVSNSGSFGSVLFCRDGLDPTQYDWGTNVINAIRQHGENLNVKEWPCDDVSDVSAAVVWKPPPGLLAKMPKLKMVQVLGAGIDGVISSFSDLSDNVKICRLIDPVAVERMASYVLAAAMDHVQFSAYTSDCQRRVEWDSSIGPEMRAETTVGILGLGEMGRAAGEACSKAGFDVVGWSRSRRVPDNELLGFRERFVGGKEALHDMLQISDVVVCMLPLTPHTHGIIDKEILSKLKSGATLVNLGRGEHVKVEDLISVLDNSDIRCAILDVFDEEPLPSDSPLWTHPKIVITPHIAGAAGEASAGKAVAENLNRVASGVSPKFVVDRKGGY